MKQLVKLVLGLMSLMINQIRAMKEQMMRGVNICRNALNTNIELPKNSESAIGPSKKQSKLMIDSEVDAASVTGW